jgi:hypothetical protein
VKLVFAPSGKRIIPYPPVGIALLAAGLRAERLDPAEPVDLEMELAYRRMQGESVLLYESGIATTDVLASVLTEPVQEYGSLLWRLVGAPAGGQLGISVMGFEQTASALLLGRIALENGARVIFGGQFFTDSSAREVIHALAPYGEVTVTIGDGWESIIAFAKRADPATVPNSYTGRAGEVVVGPPKTAKSLPPQPTYGWARWEQYEAFGIGTYKNPRPVRRAHLYVWDKQCNFRCSFCRVAAGSRAVLTPPATAIDSFGDLVDAGVGQLNFMTNELNPSRKYMLRFLSELEARGVTGADWFTYVRADRLEPSDFARMRAAGGRLARYGVESGSQPLLDLMRKDYHVETMAQTLRHAADEDVWNHVNLLVGFPGEQESDIDNTIRFLEANATSIHSARINPFYLPPDTPIAREPEAFGIELTTFDRGWWQYRHQNGGEPDPDLVVRRVERIANACVDTGVGFAGTDPFFLLDVISRHDTVVDALAYLKQEYPPFWIPAPTDTYKALIGGYEVTSEWKEIALKRQRNYSLSICTD